MRNKLNENFGIKKLKSRVIIRNFVYIVDINLEMENIYVFLVKNILNFMG